MQTSARCDDWCGSFRVSPTLSAAMQIENWKLRSRKSLNLTAVNCVSVVEPQWNPSAENQAIGRAVRQGRIQSLLLTRDIVSQNVE
jgi:hypothetical protein